MAKKIRALSALPLTPAFVVVLAACGGGTPEPQPPIVANPPATHEVTPTNPPPVEDRVGPKPEPTTAPPSPTAAPEGPPTMMNRNPPPPQPPATGTAKPKAPKPG